MLNITLEKNKIYKNFWNTFSKTILVKNSFEKENFLWILENEKKIDNYLKIANFLKLEIFKISNFGDFINLYFNKNAIFLNYRDFFNIEIKNFEGFIDKNILKIEKLQKISPTDLIKKLNKLNINFSEYEEKNSFNIKWDTFSYVDNIWKKLKISFWWDEIENIFYEKIEIKYFYFWLNKDLNDFSYSSKINKELIDFCKKKDIFTIFDELDFYNLYDYFIKNNLNYLSFSSIWNQKDTINLWILELNINSLEDLKKLLLDKNTEKTIFTKNETTIKNFLDLNNIENVKIIKTELNILKSFQNSIPLTSSEQKSIPVILSEQTSPQPSPPRGEGVATTRHWKLNTENYSMTTNHYTICDDNISRIFIKRRTKKSFAKNLDLLLQIKPGDFVVHIEHWIWIFTDIIEKELAWIKKEYIEIDYKWEDKLFVPITEIWRVSKYVWNENPKLTSLSTIEWERKLKKVSEDIEKIAGELLEIFAKRKMQKWYSFLKIKEEENKFLNSFEYIYTEDQISAIKDIYNDMESKFPMDRLICGDVGFWKTEVAFASIFKSLINEKQAVLISPLVVLAYEHFEKAKERFAKFPFNIEVLTRFESSKKTAIILEKLKTWKIDFIIWTHKLLSENIVFKDLWLLVIDEEHKFWVKDKEKIKKLRWNIDILSMSATPIPRSLNMTLNWLKDISLLNIAPTWKQAIETIVSDFNDKIIFNAWKKEFDRWWQIFFVHNRVETITWVQVYLEKLFPSKKICIAHWQLSWDKLENTIIDFKNKKYDILLATTVIENGIDFKNVNTIFINNAVNFGISQIHQLRWRVWRWKEKWYCYLLFKKDKIKEEAAKRLKTIVDYSHLWAGFELAIKDLEIRGSGDILGIRQSGSSSEVGLSLFLQMLENKIEELKAEVPVPKMVPVKIDLNIEAYIPNTFFTSELDKINFYRELENIDDLESLKNIIEDFKQINQNMKKSTINFFDLLKLKIEAKKFDIISINRIWINYQIDFLENKNTSKIEKFLKLDKEIKFKIVNLKRLRSSIKDFTSEEKFIQYLLQIFSGKIWLKFKLKKSK